MLSSWLRMLFGLVPVLFSLRRVAARGQASRPGEAKDMPAIVIVIVIVMVIVIVIAIVIGQTVTTSTRDSEIVPRLSADPGPAGTTEPSVRTPGRVPRWTGRGGTAPASLARGGADLERRAGGCGSWVHTGTCSR